MLVFRNIGIFHGIGRRLLLWFSIFFLIPLLTVSFTGYQQSKQAIQKQVYDHFESLLALQKESLNNYLRQKKIQFKSLVIENEFLFISAVVLQSTTFNKGDIQTASVRLQKYVTEKNREMGSRNLWILGKSGKVIASSNPAMTGQDRSRSPEFTDYQSDPSSLKREYGQYYVETDLKPEILISVPLLSQSGAFLGLAATEINMEDIYKILENRAGLGISGETYLVNAEGYMISPSRFLEGVILKKKVRLKDIFERKDWRKSKEYPRNYLDVPVIQAHTRLPFFGWTLIGDMETSEAFSDLTAQRNRTVLVVILLFFLLVLTAAVISRTLTQPIRELAHAAKRVSKGDFDYQVTTKTKDELTDLSLEFSRMTNSLKESKKRMEEWNATIQAEVENRTQELMKTRGEREAVYQISDIIAKTSDLDLILSKALNNILENLELQVGAIFLFNKKTNELSLSFQKGFSQTFVEKFDHLKVTADADKICVKTAFTREMQYLQDPFASSMNGYLQPGIRPEDLQTLVSLPLISEERLVGVLQVITNRKRRFSGVSLILLEALANQLAGGILRIQLEQERHQHDQFLASILTESLDAIVTLDKEDRFTSWNRGAEKIFHRKKEQVIGKHFSTLFKDPGLFKEEPSHRKLQGKDSIKDYEIENVTWDGRKVTLHISQTVILDPYGKFTGSFAIIRDITEQKEMQERIQQSEKLSSVGQLAAGIAHEIGTPLNIISGNAEYLMMDLNRENRESEELSVIINQTERIAKLIQQLMDFARNTQPTVELTDIHQLIDNILTLTRHQMKNNSITFASHLDGSLPKIVADPHQLQQVFLNIIVNAIQAMPGGGNLFIETSIDPTQNLVHIRFRDTGDGIPKEHIKNIFNPFFTTKEVGQGTGLGLAVSHRIIESHKGRITVESTVGQGTCFTLTLPVDAEES